MQTKIINVFVTKDGKRGNGERAREREREKDYLRVKVHLLRLLCIDKQRN